MLSKLEYQTARLSRDPRFDGLFFILVKTTKVFCRNTCKVRAPLEKNVEYAQTTTEALAKGFRPCLRCRPDSAPNSPAWEGVNTTVKRAIKILSNNFDISISQVAEKLGITSRYLNKLFAQHLNITPKQYKLYQQVLMAKSLLQQTGLSVDRVAEAVNLPSARQLQIHTKKHLLLTPSQIRKSSVNKYAKIGAKPSEPHCQNPATLVSNVEMLLNYRPPYDHRALLSFLELRCIAGNESVTQDTFSKILLIDQQPIEIKVQHKSEQNGFLLTFNTAFSKYTLDIVNLVKRMFDLNADPITICTALKKAGLKNEDIFKGLRLPGVASDYEAICRAILGQQVSVEAAINKLNVFHQYFALQRNQSIHTHFPLPQQVADSDLSFLKIPQARRQTLIDVAQFFTHYIDETEKNLLPSKIDMQNLANIKGIGPWTIKYLLMRGQSKTDIWLDTDLIVKKQILKFHQSGRELMSEKASPFRSYLTLNLWEASK